MEVSCTTATYRVGSSSALGVPCSGDLATDTGIALANMTLAAWAKGVGSCIMGAINKQMCIRDSSTTDTTAPL